MQRTYTFTVDTEEECGGKQTNYALSRIEEMAEFISFIGYESKNFFKQKIEHNNKKCPENMIVVDPESMAHMLSVELCNMLWDHHIDYEKLSCA